MEDVDKILVHVCPCDRTAYEYLPRDKWGSYRDVCDKPDCGLTRLEHQRSPGTKVGTISPRKYFVYLGVERIITALFSDPEFVKCRAEHVKHRKKEDGTWWASDDASRMDNALRGELFKAANSAYGFGFDYGVVFDFGGYSCGFGFIRCEDLFLRDMAKACWQYPIMITPGPTKPKSLEAYLGVLNRDLISGNSLKFFNAYFYV